MSNNNTSAQAPGPGPVAEDLAAIREASTGVSVLIVGAGTAGAFAALECWRKGHNVRIIEKAPGPYAMGDAYSIGPSAVKAFRNWPGMPEENDRISYDPWLRARNLEGEIIKPAAPLFGKSVANGPSRLNRHYRPRFQTMLMEYIDKTGIQIEWNKKVAKYTEDADSGKAGVVLSDGTVIESAAVIAADGVGTKSNMIVTGAEVPARSSGYSIYRTAYPVEHALKDPVVAQSFPREEDGHNIIETWMGAGLHCFAWQTEEKMTWSITHKDTGTAEESWSSIVDQEKVLAFTSTVPGWPEVWDRLIKTTPKDGITDFQLVWRDPSPQWVSAGGRVIQIGDAAHTFLPSSGSGATQGLEDAVSLATCLQLGGSNEIPQAFKVHNMLRRDRVSCAQLSGIVAQNARHATNLSEEQIAKFKNYGKWIWNHDAEQYANENYEKAKHHLDNDLPFQNTNIPPGYKCKPWTIADVLDNPDAGIALDPEGDWS